jgi:hypothetical protein
MFIEGNEPAAERLDCSIPEELDVTLTAAIITQRVSNKPIEVEPKISNGAPDRRKKSNDLLPLKGKEACPDVFRLVDGQSVKDELPSVAGRYRRLQRDRFGYPIHQTGATPFAAVCRGLTANEA